MVAKMIYSSRARRTPEPQKLTAAKNESCILLPLFLAAVNSCGPGP